MRHISTNDFKVASKFTGEAYGTRVTIELDHSDLGIDELMDAFKGIALGLGYSESSWNDYIRETGYDLQLDEEENEINFRNSKFDPKSQSPDGEPTFDWESDYFSMTDKDLDVFMSEIENPSEPNDELKEAAEKYNDELENQKDGIQ